MNENLRAAATILQNAREEMMKVQRLLNQALEEAFLAATIAGGYKLTQEMSAHLVAPMFALQNKTLEIERRIRQVLPPVNSDDDYQSRNSLPALDIR